MKCAKCPLFSYYQSEDESYEVCGLFGDSWEDPLQYEDKEGTVIGCYIERCYIERFAKKIDEELERMTDAIYHDTKKRDEEEPLFTIYD